MSEIQVEVCFTDKLESVRVGGKPMEIPKAVKAKPVEEWFEPAAGRVKWAVWGLKSRRWISTERRMPRTVSCSTARRTKSRNLWLAWSASAWARKHSRKQKRRLCRTTCRKLRRISRPAMPKWRSSSI